MDLYEALKNLAQTSNEAHFTATIKTVYPRANGTRNMYWMLSGIGWVGISEPGQRKIVAQETDRWHHEHQQWERMTRPMTAPV